MTAAWPPRTFATRLAHLDIHRYGEVAGRVRLVGSARDLLVAGAEVRELDVASVDVQLTPDLVVRSATSAPGASALTALVGTSARKGFRAAVRGLVPDVVTAPTPLQQLLDDVPVAALITEYGNMHDRYDRGEHPDREPPQIDACHSWRAGGELARAARSGRSLIPLGQPAVPAVDPLAEPPLDERLEELPRGSMRRRRRLEVAPGGSGTLDVRARFRDTHWTGAATETVLHQWTVELVVERGSGRIVEVVVTPGPLPKGECPNAAASADPLVGRKLGELRQFGQELPKTDGCTHLTDVLRSLDAVELLAAALP